MYGHKFIYFEELDRASVKSIQNQRYYVQEEKCDPGWLGRRSMKIKNDDRPLYPIIVNFGAAPELQSAAPYKHNLRSLLKWKRRYNTERNAFWNSFTDEDKRILKIADNEFLKRFKKLYSRINYWKAKRELDNADI